MATWPLQSIRRKSHVPVVMLHVRVVPGAMRSSASRRFGPHVVPFDGET